MKFFKLFFSKNHRLDLFWQLVKTNFKMRYQNSILGVLWVIIKPYVQFLVLFTVWSAYGGTTQEVQNYPAYLLIGIILFTYINELIIFGQMSLLERAHIILKINFPRQIVVVSALFNALINLFINLSIGFILILVTGTKVSLIGILIFFVIVGILFLFAVSISFYTSIITIKFRDLKNVLELGFFILFWISPVLYVKDSPIITSTVSNIVVEILNFNPISFFLNQARAALGVYGELNIASLLIYFIFGLGFFIVSWKFFSKQVKRVAEFF